MFGGQVAGQALVAAARTVEPGRQRALAARLLPAPGRPDVPILYEVDRIRDGRSFTTRRVVAIQHGKAIFNLQRSSRCPRTGLEHQAPMPDGARPRDAARLHAPAWRPAPTQLGDWYDRPRPIDTRYVDWSPPDRKAPLPPYQQVWLRADGTLPDDPVLHACVLTYATDMTLLDTTLLPHGGELGRRGPVHGEPRPRHVVPPPVPRRRVAALRPGHAVGLRRPGPRPRQDLHRATAHLAVSVVQEGLIRVLRG